MNHTVTIQISLNPIHVRATCHGEIVHDAPNTFDNLAVARYYAAGLHDGLAMHGIASVITAQRLAAVL